MTGENGEGESRSVKPTSHESLVERLLYRFEHVPVWTRVAIWGGVVFAVTTVLDLIFFYLLFGLTLRQGEAIMFADFTSGVLIGFIVFSVLNKRDELIKRRFREIGYLNHHVRNALMVIETGEYLAQQQKHQHQYQQRIDTVLEATTRIRKCIEQITANIDVEINEENPRAA
jgi:hypothetical protein